MSEYNPININTSAVGAIIVAAGKGSRMGFGFNKVFADLCGKPVLDHTISAFAESGLVGTLVLVISPEYEGKAANICLPYKEKLNIILAFGGAERQDSVYNGLKALPKNVDVVLIHDGARPFVDRRIIEDSIYKAMAHGAACAGIPAKDTIKIVDDENTVISTPERRFLWQAQTPQSFKKDIIINAYIYAAESGIRETDDAGVAEKAGFKVVMFEGSYRNIKLTSPEDFRMAEYFLASAKD
ncbi:MAG TPA: 2-C-methyl-D-erythritol 4-phosphate cytidylyltransferase [Clostridiaceae bacterium]|nr:2-C-methyl-D-erythritol 4-phosphate cytidylyltransferase [Clostridiaceae bacterium]